MVRFLELFDTEGIFLGMMMSILLCHVVIMNNLCRLIRLKIIVFVNVEQIMTCI